MGRPSRFSKEMKERAVRLVAENADDHRSVYEVEPICEVLPIAPSTYYEHRTAIMPPVNRSVVG